MLVKPTIKLMDSYDLNNVIDLAWNSTRGTKVPVDDLLKSPLQYRNLPQFMFRIESSMIFRDFLTEFDEINVWSETNRKIKATGIPRIDNSTYRLCEDLQYNYELVETYVDDYNSQLDKGVEEINRDKLPMGTITTYFISINFNQLTELCKLIHEELSIFNIYLDLFNQELGMNLQDYGVFTQFTKSIRIKPNKKSGIIERKGIPFVSFTFECSFSIYAQVARHKGIRKYGYFDKLINEDPSNWLYGDPIKVTLVAPKDTITEIIQTRMCCFSQSSGTGINSWYSIIEQWIGEITVSKLMQNIPCKGCCMGCPFHSDMSSREIDCPIIKHEDGLRLKQKFNNSLGDAYYSLQKIRKCSKCEAYETNI